MEKICQKCGRPLEEINFIDTKRIDKYKDGKLDICKDCLKSIDIRWILEEVDVPYIEKEWNRYLKKYNDDTVLLRYLSCMKLAGYRNFRYSDSDRLNEWRKQ